MDAAILGPILGVLTLALLWLRQDFTAMRGELRDELSEMRRERQEGRESDRSLADLRHEAMMAILRDHGERLARIEGRAEGRAETREQTLAGSYPPGRPRDESPPRTQLAKAVLQPITSTSSICWRSGAMR